ncbi:MAG: BON domain-containing protein [Pseudomonadales bacterium]|nr:BON domain-containing protein [Pseudomonadales bacterium]
MPKMIQFFSSSLANRSRSQRTWPALPVLLALLMLLGNLASCSTVISAARQNPISEDYGKRTPGAYVDDGFIETKASVNLKETDRRFRQSQVNVTSYNGVVLLSGNVPETSLRDIATDTVQKIRKVRRVHNELNVSPPRSFGAKLSDSWLATKVRTRFLFDKNIASSRIKVIANDGVIYLLGLVNHQEADTIVNKAKTIYGLQKIVRVFEYID